MLLTISMKDYELNMLQEIRDAGYNVEQATLEEDYHGIDCYINGQPVDIKAQTTNGNYDTVLISCMHTSNGKWILPGYLKNSSIQIWLNDTNCFWVIEKPDEIPGLADRFLYKSGATDKFGNKHVLAVIRKSVLKQVPKARKNIV